MGEIKQDSSRLPTIKERVTACRRPHGSPIMHQTWDKLLFINWEVPIDRIRKLIPGPLEVDTYNDRAWLTITPLTIHGVRPVYLPAVPYLSWLHELNFRTYVTYDGMPGVWFFSLDANNLPAVMGARLFFKLPYYSAEIDLNLMENNVEFTSKRTDADVRFQATWNIGDPMPERRPDSLVFFLTERYSLYTSDTNYIYRCRIHHATWPLQVAVGSPKFESSVAKAAGLPDVGDNSLSFCGGHVDVDVWPLERIARCK